MRRYLSKNSYSWNNDIAYLSGLIAADGCLYKDGRHINLTSKDIELLNYLNKILSKNYKISTKKGGYGTIAYQINFSNTSFYDFLNNIGLYFAKSNTIANLDVPDEYFTSFLRGYFDGDGTIYGYRDKRWISSVMYYVSFASASAEYLTWLQENIERVVGTMGGSIHRGSRVSNLTYAKKDSNLIFNAMYSGKNVYRLERKYARWIDFFNMDIYSKH